MLLFIRLKVTTAITAMAKATFNGGKMQHIFKLVDNLYVDEFYSEAARAALVKGSACVKVDGANHMVVKSDSGITLYQRFDSKSGECPEGYIDLPDGKNESRYTSRERSHAYFYKPVDLETGKLRRIFAALVDQAAGYLDAKPFGQYSVEVVGRKFQKTPGIDKDAALAFHADQCLHLEPQVRSYQGLRSYLLDQVCIEGVVLEHEGIFWKVRSNCFEKKCPFENWKHGGGPAPENAIPVVNI
jgi:hypothetical protein